MADLLVRVGANDEALVRRLYGLGGLRGAARVPHRLVVDAHVPQRNPELARSASRAGVPYLVDPQTHFLQDVQHAADPWAKLPYATPLALTPNDLMSQARQDVLVAQCVEHQIVADATTIIAPYVHIENVANGWPEVQAALWRRTRIFLKRNDVHLPMIAVIALGWRTLHRLQGVRKLGPLWSALNDLDPSEVGLAASRVHAGVRPDERLAELLSLVGRLSRRFPVLMWQQGLLGEACVLVGAAGYETGLGQREKCDLNTAMTSHRNPPNGNFGPRGVYIDALKRSIPKRSVEELSTHRRLWARIICTDARCCPAAGIALLGDAREHAVVSRARSLEAISQPHQLNWKWNQLAVATADGLDLAARINTLAAQQPSINKVDTAVLDAMHILAEARRHHRRARRVA